MGLKTLVKVGKISNLSDARYCAGMGVDMLGFCAVAGQDHFVSPTLFKEIRGWFSGPLVVAEAYGITSGDELKEIIHNYIPDIIELSAREFTLVQSIPAKYILSVTSEDWNKLHVDIINMKNQIEYVQIPSNTDSAVLKVIASHFRILIQDNSFDDIESMLAIGVINGISLQGSSEERPGFKSYDQLAEIFEKLEVED